MEMPAEREQQQQQQQLSKTDYSPTSIVPAGRRKSPLTKEEKTFCRLGKILPLTKDQKHPPPPPFNFEDGMSFAAAPKKKKKDDEYIHFNPHF